jgi:hypothetical protein
METNEKLLTTRGIARHFGLPFDWVIAEAKAGRLPHLRAGKRRLFNVDAVLQALLEAAARLPKEGSRS